MKKRTSAQATVLSDILLRLAGHRLFIKGKIEFMLTKRGAYYEIRSPTLRQIFDLQYRSICQSLLRHLKNRDFSQCYILDVGAGQSPYKNLFTPFKEYKSLDPHFRSDYSDISSIPTGKKFHLILLAEVLEHTDEPKTLLNQLRSLLEPEGEIWITVPFSARIHPVPEDYWRFTMTGLKKLLKDSGFKIKHLEPRGTDISSIISKLMFLIFRKFIYCFHILWIPRKNKCHPAA